MTYLIAAFSIMAGSLFLAIRYSIAQRKRRIESDGLLDAYMEGDKLRQQLAKKTEVIKHEQAADKAKVDTGNPDADFTGSLDVLRDASARRRKG